jgi:hypothetical protein
MTQQRKHAIGDQVNGSLVTSGEKALLKMGKIVSN